jgi:endoglucanase
MTLRAAALLLLMLSPSWAGADALAVNRSLSPGINYGNVFDADPPEGWGLTAKPEDFKTMAAAGFKAVRLPVRWNAKAMGQAPYTLDPGFLGRVDTMVRAALAAGLWVVLDFHHYNELYDDPAAQTDRFLGIWRQLSAHYRTYPPTLLFEILNEPHAKLGPEQWNALYPKALAVIRADNPDRVVLIDPADWGGIHGLDTLRLPGGDPNLILSFHDYAPFHFTHQGASWVGGDSLAWLGTRWTGSFAEEESMREDFAKVKAFAEGAHVPVNLGEYGAISLADQASRVRWTRAMGQAAIRDGFSRFYWEFKAQGFGAYDEKAGRWREDLRDAIVQ